jgi:PIN domain nuclease of toxin-antitoxin system
LRALLDTAVFIWALTSVGSLSKRALAVLKQQDALLELSSISLSEIAIKQSKGKLPISTDDVRAGITGLKLRILPYTGQHAWSFFDLPLHHSDPFDRQLIAQALAENIPILTSDAAFKLYKGLDVIW